MASPARNPRGAHYGCEAEALLVRLEAGAEGRRTRTRGSDYLLSGVLVTPEGKPWHGDGGNYRTRGGFLKAEDLESAVLSQVATDFQAPAIVQAYVREIGNLHQQMADPGEQDNARRTLKDLESNAARLMSLLEETSEPGPILRRLEELERERPVASDRAARAESDYKDAMAARAITADEVRTALRCLAPDLAGLDRDSLKDALKGWIPRVELDPTTRAGRVVYRLALGGVNGPTHR